MRNRGWLVALTAVLLAVAMVAPSRAQSRPEKITIAYQVIPNGEIVAKALGWHEKELGVRIDWKQFDSGRDVNTAMVAGSVDIGLVGSSPAAAGIASGIPYDVIWIYDVIADNEALVVRKGRGIKSVKDLAGKKVAAPFGSTTHYHLLVAFKVFGLDPRKATILDMQPPDMLAAWQRGDLDAGFVWEPTLIKMKEAGGEILLSSRVLADKGFLTADVAVVRRAFAERYPDLVVRYVRTLSRAVDLYRAEPREAARAVAKEFGIPEAEAERQMKTMIHLNGREQLGDKYLGTSARRGGLARALKDTADFLVTQKTIRSAPPLSAFEKAVNPSFIEKAVP
ncbi:MAG TPA: aliphatic sulfonate ABC transporter substrate-binding protein [Candidatus Binatia bacterium]|nr:aliphatic sulfonate ABC transporter substrate-binding protein [Candidatus Binatia bacterium]